MNYEQEHIEKLRPYLAECTVLLKNESDFFMEQPGEIALYGNGIRHTLKGGTGSGEVNSRYFVSVEEAFTQAGFTITTQDWLKNYDKLLPKAHEEFGKQIRKEAREKHKFSILYGMGMVMPEPEYHLPLLGDGELAIYVVSRICGEGNDRKNIKGDFQLTDSEIWAIQECQKRYSKFLLVLNVGGPIDLTPVMNIDNILILSQLGVDTGNVLVDLVMKKAYPSGKLATTWSAYEDYCTLGDFANWEDTEYREGIYVGYRYFDTVNKKALFPFGYGLSYTTFNMEPKEIVVKEDVVSISVEVNNTGNFCGKEVVQAYVSFPEDELNQPYQVLVGFEKTKEIQPGEKDIVNITFSLKDFASYSSSKEAYVLEKGNYIVRIGKSSVDTNVVCILSLEETVIIRQVKNLLGDCGFEDIKLERVCMEDVDAPIYPLHIMPEQDVIYSDESEIHPLVKELSDDELCYLSVGGFNNTEGAMNIIGQASSRVCGAAGETSSVAKEKGIPILVMSDGPAGIRIAANYYEDEKGKHAIGSSLLDGMQDSMGPVLKTVLKAFSGKEKKDVDIKTQYCTAIPIGTAIAQSFNTEFISVCGDVVGSEMERFDIDLWLAPALNIHRNVLCGRNFEYYSEDPFVSGKIASVMTQAIQKYPGRGTTIKHYAANNQETNRYNSNSLVSERAMREIYLRGFEYCVKEAQPHAVMTSYNLLNGVHTCESKSLNEYILRNEFGFKGFVMTDWLVSMMNFGSKEKYESAKAWKVINSGNDLFMPGSKKEYVDLCKALKRGDLTRSRLEMNVSRILQFMNIE